MFRIQKLNVWIGEPHHVSLYYEKSESGYIVDYLTHV
jgi:hypothetical protein